MAHLYIHIFNKYFPFSFSNVNVLSTEYIEIRRMLSLYYSEIVLEINIFLLQKLERIIAMWMPIISGADA